MDAKFPVVLIAAVLMCINASSTKSCYEQGKHFNLQILILILEFTLWLSNHWLCFLHATMSCFRALEISYPLPWNTASSTKITTPLDSLVWFKEFGVVQFSLV